MASPILRSFLFGPDYANYMMDREKLAEIEANLKPFEQRQSELSSLVGQSRAPFEPLAIRQEQPQEVMAQPSVERRLSPYGSPAISGMGEQSNARTMAQPETLDLLPVENVTQGNVEQELEKIRQTRAVLDQRRAADERIKGMGTFEQQLSSSPLSKMITDPDAQNLMPGLEKRLALMKQAEQDTVAPAREGIGQFADLYRDQVPARADLTNLLANTGRIDKAFEQASTLSGEIPTSLEIDKAERLKEKDALEREKENRLAENQTLRERMFQYTQRKDYAKAASQTGISVTALQSVDNALSELGVVGGIYGKPTEDLSAFAGAGTKFWRDWLNGDKFGDLRIATRQLVTGQLKDVSGAAVTEQEADRFMRSMGLNARSSASEFLTALQMLAKQKEAILGNALAPAEAGVKERIRQPGSGFIDPEPFAPKPSAEDEYEWDPVTRKLVRVK